MIGQPRWPIESMLTSFVQPQSYHRALNINIVILCRGCEDVAIYCDSRHVSHLRDGRFLVSGVTFPPQGLQKQSGVAIFGLVNDMSESRSTAEPLLNGSAASGRPALPWAVYELFSSNFESISRRTNVYLQQSFATRFPVHDGMIHGWAIEHQRSPEGLVLSRYGFEHCLFTLLLRSGRPVGTATVTRRTGRPPFTSQELQDRCAFSPRCPWLPPERAMRTLIPRSRRYPLGIVGRSPIAGGAHDETRH